MKLLIILHPHSSISVHKSHQIPTFVLTAI